jgi:hypothetical protein
MTDGQCNTPKPDGRKTSKNMGRPLGARDKFPRQRASALRGGLEERYRMLETELGKAYSRIAELESLLNIGKPFDGDSKALLKAVYRGEYIASPQQIYAARAVLDREWPPVKSPEELDMQRAELERERQALHRHHRDGDTRLDALIGQYDEFVADREKELAGLQQAGLVAPDAAKVIRSWWAKEPLALPAPAEDLQMAEFGRPPESEPPQRPTRAQEAAPSNTRDAASSALAGEPPLVEPSQIVRVIFANRPFLFFQTASGRRFESNSACEVELDDADPDDIKDLLRAGCRERR